MSKMKTMKAVKSKVQDRCQTTIGNSVQCCDTNIQHKKNHVPLITGSSPGKGEGKKHKGKESDLGSPGKVATNRT